MTALPAAPGVVKVQLNFTVGNDTTAMCRFFVHYTGTAPTPAEMQAFATAVRVAYGVNCLSVLYANNICEGTFVEDLSSSTGAVAADPGPNNGTRAGTPLPNGAALMIQHLIARRYRGGKPKIFLPWGVASDVDTGGVWKPAFTVAASAAWNAFVTAVLGGMWAGAGTTTQVCPSYYQGFNPIQNPVTGRWRNAPRVRLAPVVDTIISNAVEAGIASQRRRNQT